ncbi:MAG: AAA family ATPase, partial [Clostridiales bacterium]|nr:AAA family ATPase [Clostridiales bacterium]
MSVKINSLEFENVKRIKAIQLSPTKNGLTVIGGRNGQGKTSVLDSIAWALGGDKFRPSAPRRDGSVIDPHLKIILDNGITVERSGKNSSLKVTDRSGNRGGQQLLNSFVESFALDLPRFLNQTSKKKADTLLRIIGVGDELYELENEEKTLYNQRRTIGQIADQKLKFAKETPLYDGVPAEPVSASDLIKQQQNILAQNGENQRLRAAKAELERQANELDIEIKDKSRQLSSIRKPLETERKSVAALHDESTEELEKNIFDIE